MKKIAALAFVLIALCLLLDRPAVGQQGYRIIVRQDNPTDSLSKDTIADMFRKKKTRWDADDTRVVPVDQDNESEVRETFSRDVHGRSAASIVRWWQNQIFSGRGTPPTDLRGDAAIIDFVRSTPGAIGYVSPSASLNGVKAVRIEG